jgi:hypothetical protein
LRSKPVHGNPQGFKPKQAGAPIWSRARLSIGLQVLILMSATVYVAWQNSFLSDEWWVVPLRDIDDYALNASTELLRGLLGTGEWERSLSFFAYAYGLAFWFLMVVLTSPVHFLGLPEAQIFLGRTLSLLAALSTNIVVAMIGRRIYPDSKKLWLVAIGVGFITPITLIDATKMHVNSWMTLFGAIAIFLLVNKPTLTLRALYLASFFMGLAIGFKLTAVVLLPVFVSTVISKRKDIAPKHAIGSILFVPFAAIATGFPVLLAFPILPEAVNYVLGVFNTFSGLGSGVSGSTGMRVLEGLSFFGNPIVLMLLFLALVLIGRASFKSDGPTLSWSLPISIATTFVITGLGVATLVDKPAIYLATYSLSIAVFLPLGVFALSYLPFRPGGQVLAGWLLVVGNLVLSPQFSGIVLGTQNFAAIGSGESVVRKIAGAKEISALLADLKPETRVLLDSHSVFPYSDIDKSIQLTISYGGLSSIADRGYGTASFDFVVLDQESYFGMPNSDEESMRSLLRLTGKFGTNTYKLVYSNYGTLVYEIVKP